MNKIYIALFVASIENLNILKYLTLSKKQFFLLFAVSARMKIENI